MNWKAAARNKLLEYRQDPVKMVVEEFKVDPSPDQVDALRAFASNNRIAMKASKGTGKTTTDAWCAWNFLLTRIDPKVAATSISGANLKDGLWAEMAKWRQRSELIKSEFEWTKERIYNVDNPENWFMSARQWSKSADASQQADTLAGFHADSILFIIDEAGGVPDAVAAAAEAAISGGGDQKLLISGNPTHLTGPLYRACTKERSLWKVITMTGDPDNPRRSNRVSIKWAREQIAKYGADNPWVLVNVFGEFPPSSINSLLGPNDIERAMARSYGVQDIENSPRAIGCDVAGTGEDRTVIFPRQGLVAFKPVILRSQDTLQIAGRMAQMDEKWSADGIFVDATGGWGAGVIDQLRNLGRSATPILFSAKATDQQYFNLRAEMAFKLANAVKHELQLPNMPELVEEMTQLEYCFKGDKLMLIDKDIIKDRLGYSPDLTDALMTTYAYPLFKKNRYSKSQNGNYNPISEHYRQSSNSVADYNPLDNI